MELKLTTKRALEFEEKSGKDLLNFVNEAAKNETVSIKDLVLLFAAMGEGYDADKFDEWDEPFAKKVEAIFNALRVYIEGTTGSKK